MNPITTSHALLNALNSLDRNELLKIDGDVRRNLVWALEKLCFHHDCFVEATKSLMLLASAENESWGNNATGQFKQLFRPFLSGTEAPPELRLRVIDFALESNNMDLVILAISGLEMALSTYSGSRLIGAEYQGSRDPLVEWRPKLWSEVFIYWEQVLNRLCSLSMQGNEASPAAKSAIAKHIRGLMQYGRVSALDTSIRTIVEKDGPFWPEALNSIKDSQKFEGNKMPDEGKTALAEWTRMLTPSDLGDRLKLYVTTPPFEHEKGADGQYIDIAAKNAKVLAEEISAHLQQLIPYLKELLSGEQRQAYCFGHNLVRDENWGELLTCVVDALGQIQNPNISLLLGVLNGIFALDQSKWEYIIDQFYAKGQLLPYFANLLVSGKVLTRHLDALLDLVSNGLVVPASITVFAYGSPLDHFSVDIVGEFSVRLATESAESSWVALEVLAMYCHGNNERFSECKPYFAKVLTEVPLGKNSKQSQLDVYHWQDIVCHLLETEGSDFAIMVAKKIINACSEDIDYSDLWHYIMPTLRVLFRLHGRDVWPSFSQAIKASDSLTRYSLTHLLGSEDHFDKKDISVLAELPDDLLREWCNNEPDTAPVFVANATDVLLEVGDNYQISTRARFLLDCFGDNERVLAELAANMGSFGWSGSVVPYYQKEVSALETIADHEKEKVRDWVTRRIGYLKKMIDKEKIRDEEHDWGIY